MSTATRRTFQAKYEGLCGTCPAPIAVGDAVFYATVGAALVSGADCCGDRDDAELVAPGAYELPGDSLSVDDDEAPEAAIARVMPRARTARDACPKCWQIPANNGACGCDY